MPDRPLVSLQLESGSLRKVLEYLLETAETSKQGLASLKGDYEADRREIYSELGKIPKLESDLAFCVEACSNMQKLDVLFKQERVRNWSQKFLDMQEDQADLKGRLNAQSEEFRLGLKVRDRQTGREKAEEQIKEMTSRFADFELAELNRRQEALQSLRSELNQQIHDLAIGLTVESEAISEPSSPSRQNSILEAGSSAVPMSPRGDIGVLKDVKKFQNLHLRVLNLERRMASTGDGGSRKDQRKGSVLLPSDPATTHAIMDDFHHELHLRLLTLFKETNGLKETFRKISDKEDFLRDVDLPNFGNYVSYQKRIQGLEDRAGMYVKVADVETMIKEAVSARGSERKETVIVKPEAKGSPQLDSILSQLSDLRQALSDLHPSPSVPNPVPTLLLPTVQDSHPSTDRSPEGQLSHTPSLEHDTWQAAVTSLQKAVAQRVTRSELDLVAKNKPAVSARDDVSSLELTDLRSKVDSMNSKLNFYWDELNKVKTTLNDKSKAVDRLEGQLTQSNTSADSNLQRLRIELKSQIGDILTLLDRQTEDPEALKNVTSLKVVVMKLQRDFREFQSGDKGHRPELPVNATFEPESPIEDLQLSQQTSSAPRDIPQLIKRHDAEIRHMSSQLSLITDEINDLQLAAKRQSEANSQAYLRYMEEVKTDMEGVVGKVNDGLKLSQRDFEKIAELFELVGNKGDRVDLEGKAGKEDLKRAAHLLAHRVRTR